MTETRTTPQDLFNLYVRRDSSENQLRFGQWVTYKLHWNNPEMSRETCRHKVMFALKDYFAKGYDLTPMEHDDGA